MPVEHPICPQFEKWSQWRFSANLTVFTLSFWKLTHLGRVRLGSIRNKNNWNNASKRLFGSYSHSGIPGFHSGCSAPRSRIARIYSGIHSYSGIFPNERALGLILSSLINQYCVPKAAFLFYGGNSDNTWVVIVKPTVALLIQLSDKDSTAKWKKVLRLISTWHPCSFIRLFAWLSSL